MKKKRSTQYTAMNNGAKWPDLLPTQRISAVRE